jgi:hypothetical protein
VQPVSYSITASARATQRTVSWSPILALACCGPRAAEPFIEDDAAESRLAQWHQRALLDPAAEVSGLGVAHDHTRVPDRLQIAVSAEPNRAAGD